MSTNPVPATDGALDAAVWAGLQVFSTCPSSHVTPDRYRERVIAAARWSEQAGCTGTLIYTDNTLVDPWMVAQIVITNTSNLCPLVAVQPVYMHPYSAAKMVATLAFLYGRRVFLNMVAGGFKNDLAALNDDTPHDSRYERLIEYTTIIRRRLGILHRDRPHLARAARAASGSARLRIVGSGHGRRARDGGDRGEVSRASGGVRRRAAGIRRALRCAHRNRRAGQRGRGLASRL